jgi:hypothetical protein
MIYGDQEIRLTKEEINEIEQHFGGTNNMFTSHTEVWTWINAVNTESKKHGALAFAFLAILMRYTYLTPETSEEELDPIIQEIKKYAADMDTHLEDEFYSKNFVDGWGHPITGSVDDISEEKVINGKETRTLKYTIEQLRAYMKDNYHNKDITIFVSGNMSPEEFETLAKKYFSSRKTSDMPVEKSSLPDFRPNFYKKHRNEENQFKVIIALPLKIENVNDEIAAEILNHLLQNKLQIISDLNLGNRASSDVDETNVAWCICMDLSNDYQKAENKHNKGIKLALLIFLSLKKQLEDSNNPAIIKYFEGVKNRMIENLAFTYDINTTEKIDVLRDELKNFGEGLGLKGLQKIYNSLSFEHLIQFLAQTDIKVPSLTALGNMEGSIKKIIFISIGTE